MKMEPFWADVKFEFTHWSKIRIGYLGRGFALLGDAQTINATEGEIETIVDEKVTR